MFEDLVTRKRPQLASEAVDAATEAMRAVKETLHLKDPLLLLDQIRRAIHTFRAVGNSDAMIEAVLMLAKAYGIANRPLRVLALTRWVIARQDASPRRRNSASIVSVWALLEMGAHQQAREIAQSLLDSERATPLAKPTLIFTIRLLAVCEFVCTCLVLGIPLRCSAVACAEGLDSHQLHLERMLQHCEAHDEMISGEPGLDERLENLGLRALHGVISGNGGETLMQLLRCIESQPTQNSDRVASAHFVVAFCYRSMRQPENALLHLLRGESILAQLGIVVKPRDMSFEFAAVYEQLGLAKEANLWSTELYRTEAILAQDIASGYLSMQGSTDLVDIELSAIDDAPPLHLLPPTIRIATDFVRRNVQTPLRTDAIAEMAGVSRRTLESAFSKYLGVTVKDFVRSSRLERARSLMCTSRLSLVDIARQVGYQTIPCFRRDYVKRYGELPSRDRHTHRLNANHAQQERNVNGDLLRAE